MRRHTPAARSIRTTPARRGRAGRALTVTALAATALSVAAAVTALAQPAAAAPACATRSAQQAQPSQPAAGGNEQPWPQRRFGLNRLAGVADGSGVLVAVLDSGVDSSHPQLTGAVRAGIDLLDPAGDGRLDCVGHGTAVASIIAARSTPGTALRGVAPAATILPVRVSERTDGTGTGRTAPASAVAAAVRQAVDRGARVVNLSLTTERDEPALREAVRYARSRDVLLVAAAGNRRDAGNPLPFPAAYDGVVGVGAIQADGTRAPQSQRGDYVDLVAPGADVTGAAPGGGQARYTGTSFAAAYVAGAAALVRQYHPGLTEAEVARRLTASADAVGEPGGRGDFGAGTLNTYRAVTASVVAGHRLPGDSAPTTSTDPAGPATDVDRSRRTAYRLSLTAAGVLVLLLLATARRTSPSSDARYAGSPRSTRPVPF